MKMNHSPDLCQVEVFPKTIDTNPNILPLALTVPEASAVCFAKHHFAVCIQANRQRQESFFLQISHFFSHLSRISQNKTALVYPNTP